MDRRLADGRIRGVDVRAPQRPVHLAGDEKIVARPDVVFQRADVIRGLRRPVAAIGQVFDLVVVARIRILEDRQRSSGVLVHRQTGRGVLHIEHDDAFFLA